MRSDFGSEGARYARAPSVEPCEGRGPPPTLYAGLDPSGGRSPWGYAMVSCERGECRVSTAGSTKNPLEALLLASLAPVAGVDAPLSRPYRGFRTCERAAIARGARLLPGGSRGMKSLSLAGLSSAMYLYEAGTLPIEVHPGSVARSLGVTRSSSRDRHALDAVLAAVAAYAYCVGKAEVASDDSGCMLVYSIKGGIVVRGLPRD